MKALAAFPPAQEKNSLHISSSFVALEERSQDWEKGKESGGLARC